MKSPSSPKTMGLLAAAAGEAYGLLCCRDLITDSGADVKGNLRLAPSDTLTIEQYHRLLCNVILAVKSTKPNDDDEAVVGCLGRVSPGTSASVGTQRGPLAIGDSPAFEALRGELNVDEHAKLIREPSVDASRIVGSPLVSFDGDADDDVSGTVVNGYMLIGDLGRGSFGRVMVAAHVESDEVVAVKIIHRSSLARRAGFLDSSTTTSGPPGPLPSVQREIAVMKRLRHPHLVQLRAVIDDPDEDRLYLVMQYVPHGPILKKIQPAVDQGRSQFPRWEALSETIVKKYTRQLLSALKYLHQHNIVHRDVKPENILQGDGEQVFLADFGVSEFVDDLSVSRSVRGTRGTPTFWPPEQFLPDTAEVDGVHHDEWSLCVTVYVMLTGRLPFEGGTLNELGRAVQEDPLLLPDTLSSSARDFLRRGLSRDASQRFHSLADMRQHAFVVGHAYFPWRSANPLGGFEDRRNLSFSPELPPDELQQAVEPAHIIRSASASTRNCPPSPSAGLADVLTGRTNPSFGAASSIAGWEDTTTPDFGAATRRLRSLVQSARNQTPSSTRAAVRSALEHTRGASGSPEPAMDSSSETCSSPGTPARAAHLSTRILNHVFAARHAADLAADLGNTPADAGTPLDAGCRSPQTPPALLSTAHGTTLSPSSRMSDGGSPKTRLLDRAADTSPPKEGSLDLS